MNRHTLLIAVLVSAMCLISTASAESRPYKKIRPSNEVQQQVTSKQKVDRRKDMNEGKPDRSRPWMKGNKYWVNTRTPWLLASVAQQPRTSDFGFAQFISPEDQGASMRGSPLYMAPEVLAGSTYDSKADLWSLGVLVYESLFGHAPYSNCSLGQIRAQASSLTPVNIPSNTLSFECVDFLSRILQKDPAKRLSHDALFSHPFPDLVHYPSLESYQKVVELGSKAVERDKCGAYSEAFSLYCEVLNYLTPLAYEEAETEKKKSLQAKIEEYTKRAEELRCSLVREHQPQNGRVEARASPSNLCSLRVFAPSRPNLKSGLEIGEAGDMYLAEGNYSLALEKLKASLSILIPLCEAETACTQLKSLLALQIQEWLNTAEHLQSIVEANRLEQEVLNATTVSGSRCSVQ